MTKSVHDRRSLNMANSSSLSRLSFVSSLQKGLLMPGTFHKHPCQLLYCIPVSLHNKNVLLQCLINAILLLIIEFFYFIVIILHSLTLGRTLVLLWCWKGLPSGGWWWACWRVGNIPWQCSRCPCEQEIQSHAYAYPLFHWRKACNLPDSLLLFHQVSISFHKVKGCSIRTCSFCVYLKFPCGS